MVANMAQSGTRAYGKGYPQLPQIQGDVSHTHGDHPTCTTAILASPQYNPVDPISTETYRHPHGGQYGTIRDESIWERIPTAPADPRGCQPYSWRPSNMHHGDPGVPPVQPRRPHINRDVQTPPWWPIWYNQGWEHMGKDAHNSHRPKGMSAILMVTVQHASRQPWCRGPSLDKAPPRRP